MFTSKKEGVGKGLRRFRKGLNGFIKPLERMERVIYKLSL